jgi:hypothetical protein
MRFLTLLLITVAGVCSAPNGSLTITYGSTGLSSIQYNGFQYLSQGGFTVNGINFMSAGGQIIPGSTISTSVYDTVHQQTTMTFDWGTILVGYAVSNNKLNVTIKTTNNSSQTLQGVFYQPLTLIFPSTPQEFDGVDPIVTLNIGNPTALRMTAGANAVVLANDDVVLPLLVGYPWSLNGPTNTTFPVKVETSQDSMLPNSLPPVNRPIAPGASDTYHISFRFGAAAASTKSLVQDVYQKFASTYRFTQNWSDRRPIGQLIIAATAAGYPTNPRGWFNDPNVDVTTPQGVAAFHTQLLAWAQSSVAILKGMNAQGMITWDIEGEQYPQSTTYLCDPTQWETFAPEMNGVIDQYFQTFTNAGFRVGVCVRPQQLVSAPGGGAPTQITVADPTPILLSKIAYAYNRWGATLFYFDSNGDPNWPISPSFFQAVAQQYPNVLLIPENQNDQYYSISAPYDQLSQGVPATPQSVLDVYPSAFSVIYVPNGNFTQYQKQLQAGANRGDIMMFRGWYADPYNSQILTLYPPNGVAPPAPVTATPSSNSTVAGTVDVTSAATAPDGVASLQYVLDGSNIGSPLVASPYSYLLNTTGLSAGLHNLQAVAVGPVGELGFTSQSFFVNYAIPEVTLVSPLEGVTLTGTTTLTATATESAPIARVQFSIDGNPVGSLVTAPPYSFSWNSATVVNGGHSVVATATDTQGKQGSAIAAVTVQNSATGGGFLNAFTAPISSTQNLSSSGALDWVHWGLNGANSMDRMAGVTPQISTFIMVGSAAVSAYSNNTFGFSWQNGTPDASVTATSTGVWVPGENNGFLSTAPADITPRTLLIYLGVWMAAGQLQASLSDGSAAPVTLTSIEDLTGSLSQVAAITYSAASSGQLLTVTFTQTGAGPDPSSNVTLQAASLHNRIVWKNQ